MLLNITHAVTECRMELLQMLQHRRNVWDQPCLRHVVFLQVNVVRPFSENNLMSNVADEYHAVFASTPIERIHLVTIGTEKLRQQVLQMDSCIKRRFHTLTIHSRKRLDHQYRFVNPTGSYFAIKGYATSYHAAFCAIEAALGSTMLDIGNIDRLGHERTALTRVLE